MAKLDFYTIDKAEKAAIFNALAAELGMTTALLKLMDMAFEWDENQYRRLYLLSKYGYCAQKLP